MLNKKKKIFFTLIPNDLFPSFKQGSHSLEKPEYMR